MKNSQRVMLFLVAILVSLNSFASTQEENPERRQTVLNLNQKFYSLLADVNSLPDPQTKIQAYTEMLAHYKNRFNQQKSKTVQAREEERIGYIFYQRGRQQSQLPRERGRYYWQLTNQRDDFAEAVKHFSTAIKRKDPKKQSPETLGNLGKAFLNLANVSADYESTLDFCENAKTNLLAALEACGSEAHHTKQTITRYLERTLNCQIAWLIDLGDSMHKLAERNSEPAFRDAPSVSEILEGNSERVIAEFQLLEGDSITAVKTFQFTVSDMDQRQIFHYQKAGSLYEQAAYLEKERDQTKAAGYFFNAGLFLNQAADLAQEQNHEIYAKVATMFVLARECGHPNPMHCWFNLGSARGAQALHTAKLEEKIAVFGKAAESYQQAGLLAPEGDEMKGRAYESAAGCFWEVGKLRKSPREKAKAYEDAADNWRQAATVTNSRDSKANAHYQAGGNFDACAKQLTEQPREKLLVLKKAVEDFLSAAQFGFGLPGHCWFNAGAISSQQARILTSHNGELGTSVLEISNAHYKAAQYFELACLKALQTETIDSAVCCRKAALNYRDSGVLLLGTDLNTAGTRLRKSAELFFQAAEQTISDTSEKIDNFEKSGGAYTMLANRCLQSQDEKAKAYQQAITGFQCAAVFCLEKNEMSEHLQKLLTILEDTHQARTLLIQH